MADSRSQEQGREAPVPPVQAGPDFAAEAERARRGGDAVAGLDIARSGLAQEPHHTAGRVAAGLALLDLGRVDEARIELEAIVHLPPVVEEPLSGLVEEPLSGLAEDELEHAFDQAAAEPESMVDAEGIALQAVAAVERDEFESGPELPGEAFRTHSMARLLEEQGDAAGAEAIRRALTEGTPESEGVAEEAPPPAAAAAERAGEDDARPAARAPRRTRKSRVEVLEGWLHNVRRGRA